MPSPYVYRVEIPDLGVVTHMVQQTAADARALAASTYRVRPEQVKVTKEGPYKRAK